MSGRSFFLVRRPEGQGDQFYSPYGWLPSFGYAMRFADRDAAQGGLADLRRATPALFQGEIAIEPRDWVTDPAEPSRAIPPAAPIGVIHG